LISRYGIGYAHSVDWVLIRITGIPVHRVILALKKTIENPPALKKTIENPLLAGD